MIMKYLLPVSYIICLGALVGNASGAPAAPTDPIAVDATLISLIDSVAINTAVQDPYPTILNALEAIIPTATVTATLQASASVSKICAATPTPPNIFDTAAKYIEAGLSNQNVSDLINLLGGPAEGEASSNNTNNRSPAKSVYPKANTTDAPYSLPEAQLRAAIYIPPKFQYGKSGQPIILVPATGCTGWSSYNGNLIPLLQQSSLTDPVWLNVPRFMLGDAQLSSEYIAYAVNYISGISQAAKVAVVGYDLGAPASQWAFKYWPSTRNLVSDMIGISGDYRGTVEYDAYGAGVLSPPSLIQQATTSNWLAALRTQNGLSAYVPTTNIYSTIDVVVQPQFGTAASGRLNDTRNIGVTNNDVQVVCSGALAGTAYNHDTVLFNPLTFALLIDALQHAGPGRPARLDLPSVCSTYAAPGLKINNVLQTMTDIEIGYKITVALYANKTTQEPPIKGRSYTSNALLYEY